MKSNPPDPDPQILEHQLGLIAAAHPDIAVTDASGGQPREAGQPFGILFREGQLIARADVADEVARLLQGRGHQVVVHDTQPLQAGIADTDRVDLDRAQEMGGHVPTLLTIAECEPIRGIPEICRLVRESIGPDDEGFPAISPQHVFSFTPHGVLCPATEPAEVSRKDRIYPAIRDEKAGAGTSVAVLDTGFIRSASGHFFWLHGITDVDPDPLDHFNLGAMSDTPDGFIDPYTGHGTFIAGIIRRIAPATDLQVRRLDIDLRQILSGSPAYSADIVDEMRIPDHIRRAAWQGHSVISLSAGGYTLDDLPPISFRGMAKVLARHQSVLVAAAGNDASSDPFWPAAFDWTVGVGALDATSSALASYSNTGVNANVFARGSDIVNAYACGDYECFQPPDVGTIRHFHGLAKWSGTSFATPIVAGLVAARMAAQNETAPAAVAALLAVAAASHDLPGVGPTLVPEYTDLGI
jgi:subtilisin family serine protease